MLNPTDDVRIKHLRPLLPPAILMEEIPASEPACKTIAEARIAIGKALHGEDDRLLVVAGPCSIHDPKAGVEYARRLAEVAARECAARIGEVGVKRPACFCVISQPKL